MTTFYLLVIVFLLVLAVFNLYVGVSNDAVNFLNSAIGARAARFRTVVLIAAAGVLVGAMMSAGMMDIARHGIMHPANYSMHEVMVIFLAVMVSNIIILDIFNTMGLPTSTTVSLIFGLLGGTFVLALVKMGSNPELGLSDLLNSDKALSVILAIFVSVAFAFFFGIVVQYIARLVFTFNYKKHLRFSAALFGGISMTFLSYFIFIKGLGDSPLISADTQAWIHDNTQMLLLAFFIGTTVLSELLHLLRVNIFKVIVLMGTFALAMAFAGNDLVNFIGVPLAGLSSYQDWVAHGAGNADAFMMTSLSESARSPFLFLLLAGVIMIIAIVTSKKAQNVVKTSVDLSRQDEGDEMFGSSKVARSLVRTTQEGGSFFHRVVPERIRNWADGRFNQEVVIMEEGAAFDMIRAAINLVLSSVLVIIGTNYKLPLSTTYVTFMVAMGTSLADRAWSRESAVFRVTGVFSVIGGWFITAGATFATCAVIALLMYYLGPVAMLAAIMGVVIMLIQSNRKYSKAQRKEQKDDAFTLMMRSRDPEIVWDLLYKHVSRTQSFVCRFAQTHFNNILDGLIHEDVKSLRNVQRELEQEQEMLKKIRKKEFLAMRRIPEGIAIERNTWFHLGSNSNQQFIYCLKRMLDPVKEHVDNNFNPIPQAYIDDFEPVRRQINELISAAEHMISTNRYDVYQETLDDAEECKNLLSKLREQHIDRMQRQPNTRQYKVSLVYLNLLQESQEFLSILRHQLRAAKKFLSPL